jgi:hypothetical protein
MLYISQGKGALLYIIKRASIDRRSTSLLDGSTSVY